VARLILLNGPPGIGKSTVAARYADEHPGTLNCDIDLLRTMIGGWEDDYAGAGALIRPVALAMITVYLRESGDVVLPQLLARESELERFVAAGTAASANVSEVLLMADPETCVVRFEARDATSPQHRAARETVNRAGGTETLRQYHAALTDLTARRPWTRVVEAGHGDVEGTYRAVLDAVPG
jgi:cytidylate kinase